MAPQDSITIRTYDALSILLDRFRAGQITLLEFKQQVLETFQEGGTAWSDPVRKTEEYLMGGPGAPGVLTASQKAIDTQAFPDWKLPFQAMEMGDEDIVSGVPQTLYPGVPTGTLPQRPADLPITVPTTIAGEPVDYDPTSVPTQTQFSRFMAGRPGLPTPLARSASALLPQIQSQFALQPPVPGGTQSQTFRDFLSGGQFLRGEDLQQRLASVAEAVRQPMDFYSPTFIGTNEWDPRGSLMGALQTSFQDPTNAFGAFMQPYLSQLGPGRGRNMLENAFGRWQQGYMGRNPAATSGDIAALFGF